MKSKVIKNPSRAAHAQVRDRREHGFFHVDNELIDCPDGKYQTVSVFGLAVYAVLCRYAQNKTECKVLLETIAKGARTSRSSVSRGIAELEEVGLIAVERLKKHSSVYTLLRVEKVAKNEFPIETQKGNEFPIRTQTENEFLLDTQNKTKNLIRQNPSPVTQEVSKEKLKPDVRTQEFKKIIQEVHKSYTHEHCPWDGFHGHGLKHFLIKFPELTAFGMREWLKHYWNSQNINPADLPSTYIPRLYKYRFGPLNEFGKPLNKGRASHEQPDYESPALKTRRQLQGGSE